MLIVGREGLLKHLLLLLLLLRAKLPLLLQLQGYVVRCVCMFICIVLCSLSYELLCVCVG